MNEIWYNNKNAFSGISATPFVSIRQESDGYWMAKKSLDLDGQIIGCGTDFTGVFNKASALISNFTPNFKNLQIKQEGDILFSADYAIVTDISFEESDYAYWLPYTINIDAYDANILSGQYYVTSPASKFSYSEQKDGLVAITHEVSAKGINGPQPAINNAYNWVAQHTGLKNIPNSAFIKNIRSGQPILISIAETIDRIAGSYSVREEYLTDQIYSGYGILRYSVSIDYDKFNFTTVTINGNIDGGLSGSLNIIRDRYKSLNLWSLAFDVYSGCTQSGDLNSIYLTSGVDEDPYQNTISFAVDFNNDNSPMVYVNSKSEYEVSYDMDGNDSASVSSTIKCRAGNLTERMNAVKNYFSTSYNALAEFAKNMSMTNAGYNLSYFKLKSESLNENISEATIQSDTSWDVKQINVNLPCYIRNLTYTVTKKYPLQQYEFLQPLCTSWNAYGTHVSKTEITIQGSADIDRSRYSDAEAYVKNIASQYKLAILKNQSITNDSNNAKINFEFTYEEY